MKPDRTDGHPVLDIDDLHVDVIRAGHTTPIVRGVSLSVDEGEIVALIGESGSGKTTIARSILRLLGPDVRTSGHVRLGGVDLATCSGEEMRRRRGRDIGFVPQDALSALDPRLRVGRQLADVVRAHEPGAGELDDRVGRMLAAVGLPAHVRSSYPHQLSGGMRQRVIVAMAMINRPRLLVTDEPTTALDVTVQSMVLDLLRQINESLRTSILLITHDLGVVGALSHRVVVLYGGRVMEAGPTQTVLRSPSHPYTRGLLESLPERRVAGQPLLAIPGHPTSAADVPSGCPFHPRCTLMRGRTVCSTVEPVQQIAIGAAGTEHTVACHFVDESAARTESSPGVQSTAIPSPPRTERPILQVRDLRVTFPIRSRGSRATVDAVAGVTFEIHRQEVLALVGESGSGKSTTGRSILGLVPHATGSVMFRDVEVLTAGSRELRDSRRHMQVVLQDPYSSLNPRMTVGESVVEPLRAYGVGTAKQRRARARELLDRVGLNADAGAQYPHQLSGGMRQRASLARALSIEPALLVLDEPLSALDVSIQAQVLNLLSGLREDFSIGCLFITHNLLAARHIADRVAVIYMGTIVEIGPTEEVFARPSHPYTAALLSSVLKTAVADPKTSPGAADERSLRGDMMPSSLDPPSGCRFRTRCGYADSRCETDAPLLRERGPGHYSACHFPERMTGSEIKRPHAAGC